MRKISNKLILGFMCIALLSLNACATSSLSEQVTTEVTAEPTETEVTTKEESQTQVQTETSEDRFTERDLTQTVDTSKATALELKDNEDISIDKEGIYLLEGEAKNVTISINVDSQEKVQIVLDGVNITNDSSAVINVINADKVFITTTDSTNTLTVKNAFVSTGDTNVDGVIFSKDDVVLNGLGTLNINSSDNGVVSKDDLKVTGGTINITCENNGLEANDAILVADGNITITSNDDGLHAENDEDDTVGEVYIASGNFVIDAVDDAIRATTTLTIDGGTLELKGTECLEATVVRINDGTITIDASDDGVNASSKSSAYNPLIEINGGDITISMAQGDTDALDANGDLYINGGTINISGPYAFDYDGKSQFNGGTVIVNGQEVDAIDRPMFYYNGQGSGGGKQEERPEGFNPGQRPDGGSMDNMPGGFNPEDAPQLEEDGDL